MVIIDLVPLPRGKHLGILLQGEVERTPCGLISQLDICQLLSASPQVVYPTGLNGHREPIITTLPEPLSSSMSIIASKHSYLEIDIPPNGESDIKILPIGKVSIIQTTNLHNPPPNPKGSIATEVNHLLDQVMAEHLAVNPNNPPWRRLLREWPPLPQLRSQKLQFHPLIHHLKPAWKRQKAPLRTSLPPYLQ